jgi:5-formyltetrahydrofolate cyclo-ligase
MTTREYSSPPCYLHELDDSAGAKLESWDDIKAWRKARREALIRHRLVLDASERQQRSMPIIAQLLAELSPATAPVLGIYWPFRGEIDVRDLAHQHIAGGGIVALPVVVQKAAPVEFWRWRPEVPMSRGLFNIPVPGERERVNPDVLIVPLVGFDRDGYRLGYGGGYYDKTLAAASPRPRTIGIAFAEAELPTIHPQPHDIPMNRIVTDRFAFDAPVPGSQEPRSRPR